MFGASPSGYFIQALHATSSGFGHDHDSTQNGLRQQKDIPPHPPGCLAHISFPTTTTKISVMAIK